jgi:hypothetical protein
VRWNLARVYADGQTSLHRAVTAEASVTIALCAGIETFRVKAMGDTNGTSPTAAPRRMPRPPRRAEVRLDPPLTLDENVELRRFNEASRFEQLMELEDRESPWHRYVGRYDGVRLTIFGRIAPRSPHLPLVRTRARGRERRATPRRRRRTGGGSRDRPRPSADDDDLPDVATHRREAV